MYEEKIEADFELLISRGEIIFQDEVTEDRWEMLLVKCKEQPEYYIEGEGFIQIIPTYDYPENE